MIKVALNVENTDLVEMSNSSPSVTSIATNITAEAAFTIPMDRYH